MRQPDFAEFNVPQLSERDLLFLFEHFPQPGVNAVEAVRRVHENPSTLESILDSAYVHEAMMDRSTLWLDVSPQLFFNVRLRHCLKGRRTAHERRTLHYLAHVLTLFVRTERLYRVAPEDEQPRAYLADLLGDAAEAGPERQFLVHCHIGNYALYLSGLCAQWIEHRHRYRRRPVSFDYYCSLGRSCYGVAAQNWRASRYGLRDVFHQLSGRFDYYRGGLQRLATRALAA
jgi:hypothetical protein